VFNRFGQGSKARDNKEIMHMQPGLFLLDTDNFLQNIDNQMEQIEEKERNATPTQKKRKTELDYGKEKQIENLHSNNKILKQKME
jgi:hypothetical protein